MEDARSPAIDRALFAVSILLPGCLAASRALDVADAAHDEPTADLLTQRLAVHEQTAWMLRSLLE